MSGFGEQMGEGQGRCGYEFCRERVFGGVVWWDVNSNKLGARI